MNKKEIYDLVILIYQELFRQLTLRSTWEFKPKQRDVEIINKFVDWCVLQQGVNFNWLENYFLFQFGRYVGLNTKRGKNQILIHWLVGENAIKEYKNRVVGKDTWKRYKIKKETHLNLLKIFKKEEIERRTQTYKDVVLELNQQDEIFKQKFYNQQEGLIWCFENTTLHHPSSKWCNGCNYADSCLQLQQKHLNRIYNLRKNL